MSACIDHEVHFYTITEDARAPLMGTCVLPGQTPIHIHVAANVRLSTPDTGNHAASMPHLCARYESRRSPID